MRRASISLVLALSLVAALVVLTGCWVKGSTETQGILSDRPYSGDYAVAVIKTSYYSDLSMVQYYDEDLKLICIVKYPYASLENLNSPPSQSDGMAFIASRGQYRDRSGRFVVGIDTQTGEDTSYKMAHPPAINATATKDYIFVLSGIDFSSHITRIDRRDGSFISVAFDNCFLTYISSDDSHVFVTQEMGYKLSEDGKIMQVTPEGGLVEDDGLYNSFFIVLDHDLNIESHISLKGLGSPMPPSGPIDGKVFFLAMEICYDEEDPRFEHYIYTYNFYSISDRSIHTVYEPEHNCMVTVSNEGYLFVMQEDPNFPEANNITVLDLGTLEVVGSYLLPFVAQGMGMNEGFLYVYGYNRATSDYVLVKLSIDGPSLVFAAEVGLRIESTLEGIGRERRYLTSGMFFREG